MVKDVVMSGRIAVVLVGFQIFFGVGGQEILERFDQHIKITLPEVVVVCGCEEDMELRAKLRSLVAVGG